jgi:hypothetical protein
VGSEKEMKDAGARVFRICDETGDCDLRITILMEIGAHSNSDEYLSSFRLVEEIPLGFNATP